MPAINRLPVLLLVDPCLLGGAELDWLAVCSVIVSRRGEVGPEKYELAEPFLESGSLEVVLPVGEVEESGDFGLDCLANVMGIAQPDYGSWLAGACVWAKW